MILNVIYNDVLTPLTVSESKNGVLVIEDSQAIALLVRDFLKKMGYNDIQICNTGKAGIQIFSDLVHKGKIPIVMLDFHLPDMTAKKVMESIFNIRPGARVIIETADSKGDEDIRETLRNGAYQYIEKPIRFEVLKNIFETLEDEKNILDSNSAEDNVRIESFFKSSPRISVARLSEYSSIEMDKLRKLLREFENKKKIVQIGDVKEIACNQCGSVRIAHNFFCPACRSSNFKQGKLIEHFKCGNVSTDDSYKQNICPKCQKEIKVLGVDYKAIDNYYICNYCNEKFPELSQDYICVKCNNQFILEKAKWANSEGYKIN